MMALVHDVDSTPLVGATRVISIGSRIKAERQMNKYRDLSSDDIVAQNLDPLYSLRLNVRAYSF